MRRGVALPALAGLAIAFFVPLAAADEPPTQVPPKAAFDDSRIDLGTGSLRFEGLAVRFDSGRLARPVAESEDEVRYQLMADVLFDFDAAALRPEAGGVLRDLVGQLAGRFKRPSIRVEGHTDAVGSDDYNQGLSERRAAAVKAWLVGTARLPSRQVSVAGFGERQPIAANTRPDGSDDPQGRQKNRRVEIVVTAG